MCKVLLKIGLLFLMLSAIASKTLATFDEMPYIDFYPITDPLRAEDLSGFRPEALRLIRNAIYARHGRVFKDPQLQRYFQSQSWYRKNLRYNDSSLSALDRKNAQFIVSYEQRARKGQSLVHPNKRDTIASLDHAMRSFIHAVRKKNSDLALYYVPKTGLKFRNTISGFENQTSIVAYAELKKDKSWINYIKYADVTDEYNTGGLAGLIRRPKGDDWRKDKPTKFTLVHHPESFSSVPIYILWRRQGDRWIIAEIGYPQA